MNKKLITLAVAGAMVAPLAAAADTTLYGRIHTSLVHKDGSGVTINPTGVNGVYNIVSYDDDAIWDVETYTTRIGVKGSEDLGNGLKAIFQAEWAFSSSEGGSYATGNDAFRNRLAYAGLSGGFGTAAIGRQWTPYYGAVDKADIFNTPGFNPTYLGTFRTGNALAYVTPNFGGFVAKAAVVIDGPTNPDDSVDGYNLSAEYNNGPISVGLGYRFNESGKTATGVGIADVKGWGIAGSYNFGMFRLIGQYEDMDVPDVLTADVSDNSSWKEWAIGGEAYFGKHTIKAMYGDLDYDVDSDSSWALGYQYSMSKRTRVYAEYGDLTGTERELNSLAVGSVKKFSVGLRHDF